MNLQYNFRVVPELVWFVVIQVVGVLLWEIAVILLDIKGVPTMDDLQTWGVALFAATSRALGGAIMAALTKGGFQLPGDPGPPQG